MKNISLMLCLLIIACGKKKESETIDTSVAKSDAVISHKLIPKLLISPGEGIGNISLGQNAEQLDSILGKPDLSDAAMGKAWMTWFSKVSDSVTGNELNVYTTYADNEMKRKVVQQIRITSPEFKTADGSGTGKSLDDIQKIFPNIKPAGNYDVGTPTPVAVFDDVGLGIAFEFENNICSGIIIHRKGRKASEEYLTFHPDMVPI